MLRPAFWGEDLFDRFFEDFARPVRRRECARTNFPELMKTDVRESDQGFELDVELPGYKKEDVKAELKDGVLTISAEQTSGKEDKDENGRFIRRERYFGSCVRSFYVGENLKEEDIKARFEDGILKLAVPKKEAQPAVEDKHYIAIEG